VALVPPFDTIAEHYIGGKTKMEIKVVFPVGTTAFTIIEVLPSTNTTVMALGVVTVTPPSPSKIVSISGSNAVTRHITDDTLGVSFSYTCIFI
jgi:predicted nucleic acid-binding OB-fold protein